MGRNEKRKFGGDRFPHHASAKTKKAANTKAYNLRQRGARVRVTKSKTGYDLWARFDRTWIPRKKKSPYKGGRYAFSGRKRKK
jgi:hypothetical protein